MVKLRSLSLFEPQVEIFSSLT